GTLTVTKAAALTVTADNKGKVYGAAEPTLSYMVTGTTYYTDAAQAVVSGVALSTTIGSAATAGTHAIVATGGLADNYAVTDVNGMLTVNQAAAITSAGNTTFTAGSAGSFTVTAVGFPAPTLSESVTDVRPGGVTFNAATGVLSGTPAAGSGGVYILHFTAHN